MKTPEVLAAELVSPFNIVYCGDVRKAIAARDAEWLETAKNQTLGVEHYWQARLLARDAEWQSRLDALEAECDRQVAETITEAAAASRRGYEAGLRRAMAEVLGRYPAHSIAAIEALIGKPEGGA